MCQDTSYCFITATFSVSFVMISFVLSCKIDFVFFLFFLFSFVVSQVSGRKLPRKFIQGLLSNVYGLRESGGY